MGERALEMGRIRLLDSVATVQKDHGLEGRLPVSAFIVWGCVCVL